MNNCSHLYWMVELEWLDISCLKFLFIVKYLTLIVPRYLDLGGYISKFSIVWIPVRIWDDPVSTRDNFSWSFETSRTGKETRNYAPFLPSFFSVYSYASLAGIFGLYLQSDYFGIRFKVALRLPHKSSIIRFSFISIER